MIASPLAGLHAGTEASAAELEARYLLPVYKHLALEPVRGEGVWLETADGRRVLDLYGGHAVALLGYGHPRLLAALAHQAAELHFQSNAVPNFVRGRAAEALIAFAPEGLEQAFFVNSGAEANENALRLAFRRTGRRKVVAIEGAFHGRTAAAAAVSWGSERWYGFPAKPFDVEFVPRGDFGRLAQAVDSDTAALILEPVQGLAGAYALGREFLVAAREVTEEAGALLIFDEVQCGLGRSGAPFSARLHGVTPDILTVGKGLAGGLPAAALVVRPEAMPKLAAGDLGTTFGGGPLVCAAIEATLDALVEEGLMPRVRVVSRALFGLAGRGPVVAVQGEGLLLGLRTRRPAREIQAELLARDILVGTSDDPFVVRLLPPLTLGLEHVALLAAALQELAE
ncbi:MAG: aspartate aminotransferase family protein [Thermoanaerobaculia bacterium]|jgi:acetylornithine/succinyldiaminopimelate/putrescine aminotransferase|nr:aspartate aminotransferase family protein [Thermoanaerobaculia bacterium]MBP9825694.1 aspartate aminotransferase family protein [Thermoanaerobaculia bacterium]